MVGLLICGVYMDVVLDFFGMFFFVILGFLLVVCWGFDIVGFVFLGVLMGLGGGVVCDLILGVMLIVFL